MVSGDATSGEDTAWYYRVCDSRFPFLWATVDQPPARWHGVGEGPCHYLATSAKGAWAEVLRHEEIDQSDDLVDLERSLWEVEAPTPQATPQLPYDDLTGDKSTWPACQDEARRLKEEGYTSLEAPSAALLSGRAERYGVDLNGMVISGEAPSKTVVHFGDTSRLVGMLQTEGHPDPTMLGDVRHF